MSGDNKNFAIQILNLDAAVNEYQISKIIAPYAKANIELEGGTARLRDYSPQLIQCLKDAFPEAQVTKIGRLDGKGRAFFQSMNRLMVQRFQAEHTNLDEGFIIIKSTPAQSQNDAAALKFIEEVLTQVAIRDVKIITSRSRVEAVGRHSFKGPNGEPLKVEAIINESRDSMGFKKIQIKGWVQALQLDKIVGCVNTLTVIPQLNVYRYERVQDGANE